MLDQLGQSFQVILSYITFNETFKLSFIQQYSNLVYKNAGVALKLQANSLPKNLERPQVLFLINLVRLSKGLVSLDLTSIQLTQEDALLLIDSLKNTQCHFDSLKLFTKHLLLYPFEEAFRICSIRRITLAQNSFESGNLKNIFKELNHWKTTSLCLEGNKIGDKGAEIISHGLCNSKIEFLNLSNNSIGDRGVELLSKCLPCSRVSHLEIQTNFAYRNKLISDKGAKAIAQVLPECPLESLVFKGNSVRSVASICSSLPLSKLSCLNLGDNKIGNQGAKDLAKVLPVCQLKYLDVGNNQIGSSGCIALGKAIKHSQLVSLKLYDNSALTEGAEAIAEGLAGSLVQSLDLASNSIGDSGIEHLSRTLSSSCLVSLNLKSNSITKQGISFLVTSLAASSLQALDLSCNFVEEGVQLVADQLSGTSLSCLKLTRNRISEEGGKALGEVLSFSRLSTLKLSNNKIGTVGAKAIAFSLPDSQLHKLEINANQIQDEGGRYFVEKIPSSKLKSLKLRDKTLTQETNQAISNLCSRNNIRLIT